MYRRCEYCHRPLKQTVWRKLGYGLDCAIRYGLWIPPGIPRTRRPDVRQAETLFDLPRHAEEDAQEEPWITPHEDACSAT